jgi:predicted ATP-grasp superfamily ATP-dependent carboligase
MSMRDPSELVQLAANPGLEAPVMIEALDGFIDAGHAVRRACEHLLSTFGSEEIASFEIDELLDYRARRPPLIFDTDHWQSYEQPNLAVHLLRDASGEAFLLLTGPEPDTQWERFIAAALLVVEHLNVRLTIGLHGVPWQAPHTRPVGITAHGQPPELLSTPPLGIGRVQVPASVGHLLEYRLAATGRAAIGFAAHVPHYLSLLEYPAAAAALLAAVEQTAGLSLSLDALHDAAAEAQTGIDAQISQDEQAQSVIRELEDTYDAARADGRALQAEQLPSGEELGAAFQRFLAERSRRAGPDDPAR